MIHFPTKLRKTYLCMLLISTLNTAGVLKWEGSFQAQLCLIVVLGAIVNHVNSKVFHSITQLYCFFRKHWELERMAVALKNGKVCFAEQNYWYAWWLGLWGWQKCTPWWDPLGAWGSTTKREFSLSPCCSVTCSPEPQGHKWSSQGQNTGQAAQHLVPLGIQKA